MPGLIREARDMQGIRESSRKSGGDKSASPSAANSESPAPTERGPRKKGS
jgi:hypothetical protein